MGVGVCPNSLAGNQWIRAELALPSLRWGVLHVDLEPVEGHEQGGSRPALVVSFEAFHRSGLALVCPITAARSEARRSGEVPIPLGEAGRTKPGVILCHQARTISIRRASGMVEAGRQIHYLTDPQLRTRVREALSVYMGLDIPGFEDGASVDDYFEVTG